MNDWSCDASLAVLQYSLKMATRDLTLEKTQQFETKLQHEPGTKVLMEYAQHVGIPTNNITWIEMPTADGTFQQYCAISGKPYQPGSKETQKKLAKHSASKMALSMILAGAGNPGVGAVPKTKPMVASPAPMPMQGATGGHLTKDSARKRIVADYKSGLKTGKSALDEYRKAGPDVFRKPEYTEISCQVPGQFSYRCSIDGMGMFVGTAPNKKAAQHDAAGKTLLHLDKSGIKPVSSSSPQQRKPLAIHYPTTHVHDPGFKQAQLNPKMDPFYMDAGGDEASGGGRYLIKGPTKGRMLIINMKQGREGSELDVQRLTATFEKIGYKVQLKEDLTALTMLTELSNFARIVSHTYSTVVAIFSHGKDGKIQGSDGRYVAIKEIMKLFNTENCPKLNGKPKFFIFQACRGEDYDRGSLRKDSEYSDPFQSLPAWSNLRKDAPPRIPLTADMLTAYATVAGFAAGRDEDNGSIFIQKLCDVFDAYAASNMHVLDLLARVNGEVSHWEGVSGGQPAKQMPEVNYTLTKNWYFY